MTGLAMSYTLQLTLTTVWAFQMATEVENLMTSVERVMTYAHLQRESGYEYVDMPRDTWPEEGVIQYDAVSLSYFPEGPPVLKDINATIQGGERIGIVGRTGAGKSSLVAALFRMPECRGNILIDGIAINTLNLQTTRSAIAVIPQNPFLFNGSLRMNLDPRAVYSDENIWQVLENVQMKSVLEERDNGGQLHCEVMEQGSNFSVGERQLICLARALLQGNKIIVLDEATANVDYKTDQILQNVIRRNLKGRTLLTIAHRLDTVIDYDRIIVVEGGEVVEFDRPSVLLQRDNGPFSNLYRTYCRGNSAIN